jgi:hypothetical protein
MSGGLPRASLAPGYSISRLLKGGWQLAGGHGPIDTAAALDDMDRFAGAGITTFVCADIYAGVEAVGVGRDAVVDEVDGCLRHGGREEMHLFFGGVPYCHDCVEMVRA